MPDRGAAPQSMQERHACFFDPMQGPDSSFLRCPADLSPAPPPPPPMKMVAEVGKAVQAFSAASSNGLATNSTVGSQQDVPITSHTSGSCAGVGSCCRLVAIQLKPPTSIPAPNIALRVTPNLQEFVLAGAA